MFIWWFGPPILFSTKHFESFNHMFQLSAVFSNCQAPSHNMCQMFAWQDDMKHIVTGGFWHDLNAQHWVQAGQYVWTYMDDHPQLWKLMGIPNISPKHPGMTHLATWDVNGKKEVVPPVEWHTTQAAKLSQSDLHQVQAYKLFYCINSVMTMDGNKVLPAGFVIFQHSTMSKLWIGKIVEILSHHYSPFNVSHIVLS